MDGSSHGWLTSASFQLGISAATGALDRITHPADAHAMNWVCNPADTPWHPIGNGWGLGHVALPWRGVAIHRWQVPTACSLRDDRAEIGYALPMLQISATRRLTARDTVEEHYAFRNTTGAPLDIGRISIATPWNDNYPDAETCLTRRCNAHVWCGGTTTYTYGLRMGNTTPHLGLVVTEGDFTGYSIEDRGLLLGSSNLRGTILLNHRGVVLAPGATLSIRWRLFWHQGAEDFFAQALTVPGFMRLDADRYTLALGETATIRLQAPTLDAPVTLAYPGETGAPARLAPPESCVAVQPRALGDCVVRAEAPDGRHTWLRLWTAPPLDDLVRARVNFILDHQQVTDVANPRFGALLPYDNLPETPFRNPHWPDQNEGRERLGMGVLLALKLQREPSPRLERALRDYHAFVRGSLQAGDGTVRNGLDAPAQRFYNYPWVAQFHLACHAALGEARFLDDLVATCRAYYARGGHAFYCIGMPVRESVEALRQAGRLSEAQELLAGFRRHADTLVATGKAFPAHEVNYEQTIVAPAVWIVLEFYLLTREPAYLDHVRALLPLLEAFNGRQPDHHLNTIAIRHWDGFWFGRRRLWGDTFPHYWSSVSGYVFHLAAAALDDSAYAARAKLALMNNLSLFTPDGRGSCAHIYPESVNGELANDQDWALVYLLKAVASGLNGEART
jgi:hypothetical protein